jgi:hypothetical protein
MKEVNSWADITVGQYQEMMLIETDNEISKFIQMISIALDCDPEEIRSMPFKEYSNLQQKMQFIATEPQKDVRKWLEIDGKFYGLEPDMSLITAGVFIDAEQFRQDPIVNLHNTLALIYRPITNLVDNEPIEEYQIEPHKAQGFEKRANLFRDKVSIEVVLGATLFFSMLGMELSIVTLESFNKTLEMEAVLMKTRMTQTPTKKHKPKPSKKGLDSTI